MNTEPDTRRLRLAVLFGGRSPEYAVSLQSAASVLDALDKTRYDVVMLGVTRAGDWYLYSGDTSAIRADTWHENSACRPAVLSPSGSTHGLLLVEGGRATELPLDAAFPVMHGAGGEDGGVQGLLELAGIPVVGCGTLASALCMDKELAHTVAAAAGVSSPAGIVLRHPTAAPHAVALASGLTRPLFVKPARAGSSFGVACCETDDELLNAVRHAFTYDGKVLIEERAGGFEIGVAVMGRGDALVIGEVDEIELGGPLFDYTEKYSLINSKIHMPARISPELAAQAKAAAAAIYRALECTGFARVDLFATPNGLLFNEVNTIPGFTEHSRFPGMMRGIGLGFGEVLDRLIEQAVGT